nr:MAG TPA_asm: hypothetical protein [Bacteriophage sp.]
MLLRFYTSDIYFAPLAMNKQAFKLSNAEWKSCKVGKCFKVISLLGPTL